jgi:hypothetical protein
VTTISHRVGSLWVRLVNPDHRDLAFHLVSVHCDPMAIARPHEENLDQHDHEHRGPGTIRNHPASDCSWDAEKLEAVLEEMEEDY